jgi:hypothetical protein
LARLAQTADLVSLLDLYRAAEVSSSAEPKEKAEQIWLEMLSHESFSVFVSAVDAQIVANLHADHRSKPCSIYKTGCIVD